MMTELIEYRNKWENQYIKKKNRKRGLSKGVRQRRKIHGRSSNSHKKYTYDGDRWPAADPCYRLTRMTKMKYNTDICNNIMRQNVNDDIISIKYNSIPIWICSKCTYRNIERGPNCKICNISYSSMKSLYNKYSDHITLDEFCENEWRCNDSIAIWICSKCTYCNIDQLTHCQICGHRYNYYTFSKQNDKTKSNKSNKAKPSYKSNKRNKSKNSNKYKYKYNIIVGLKLNINCWFDDIKSFKMNGITKNYITYYGVSECNISIKNAKNSQNILYSLIPSTSGCNKKYKSLSNVIVPISTHYWRNNNNPLKSIASLIWSSRFNRMHNIKPNWNNPDLSNLKELTFLYNYQVSLDVLSQFIPSYICESVLFQYIHSSYSYVGQYVYYKRDRDRLWYKAKILRHKKESEILSNFDVNKLVPSKLKHIEKLQKLEAFYIRYERNRYNYRKWIFIDSENDLFCSCQDMENCQNYNHILKFIKIIEMESYHKRYHNASKQYAVTINGSILLNKNILNLQSKYKKNNKINLFMAANKNKFPLKLYDTKLSTIRTRRYDDFECVEIGYTKNDTVNTY